MQVDYRTALQAVVRLSANAELELFHNIKRGPLVSVLLRAREDAIEALVKLVSVPPDETENVRKLQNEVQRFIDLLIYTRATLEAGDQALEELKPDEQEELRRLLVEESREDAQHDDQ